MKKITILCFAVLILNLTFSQTAVTKHTISTSANPYSLIMTNQTCLDVNPSLDLMTFTHRANPSAGLSTSSGHIVVSKSTNGGSNWSQIILTSDTSGNRYPSGVIYNPTGNTNPNNAYIVSVGPTVSSNNWTHNFFASSKLDSSGFHTNYLNSTNGYFLRNGLSCHNNRFNVSTYEYANGIFHKNHVFNGIWNSTLNKADWIDIQFYHPFRKIGGEHACYSSNSVWSNDGSIGYIYFIGIDSINNMTAPQPIVYKSTNYGTTWNMLPFYNFANLNSITDLLWSINTGNMKKPYFSTVVNDAVVDSLGQLHIIAHIQGAFSNHADSLNWFWLYEPAKIFDVSTTSTGWQALLIDSLSTSDYTWNGLVFNSRLQAAKNSTGSKIFAVWADSDPNFYTENEAPNLFACGWDISNCWERTSVVNFTENTIYNGNNYFHFVSPLVIKDGNTYKIPVTTSDLGYDDSYPVTHKYVSGIEFNEDDFYSNNIYPSGSISICDGNSVLLSVRKTSGFSYQWKKNGLNVLNATDTSLIVTQSGSYSIEVSTYNCTNTSTPVVVTVNPIPAANISAAGSTTICDGDSVVLNANTGTGLTYQWKINGINIFGATSSSYTASQTGNYTVLITSKDSCSNTSNSIYITVNSNPTKPTIIGANSVQSYSTHQYSVTLQAGVNYNWSVQNGNIVSGQTTNLVNIMWGNNGVGKIIIEVSNSGCYSFDTLNVNIGNVGVNENTKSEIQIFPNPSNNFLFIITKDLVYEVEIYDVLGEKLYQRRNSKLIDISNFPTGVYLLKVFDKENKIIKREKIIKL